MSPEKEGTVEAMLLTCHETCTVADEQIMHASHQ